MPLKNVLSVVAGILFVLGYAPYITGILKKQTKPSKASWLIWATLDLITIIAMLVKHTVNGQIVGAVAGSWIVVALAFKYGTPGWSRLDKFCLGGAALGLALWKIFGDPVFGLVTSQSVVLIASFPTFASAWRDPRMESRLGWTCWWLSCVLTVIAIPHWTLMDAFQPIVWLAIETTMMFILFVKPLRKREKPCRNS